MNKQATRPQPSTLVVLGILLVYWITSFLTADHYGMTTHGENCIGLGHKYLHYYTSGKLDFEDILHPAIPGVDARLFYDTAIRKDAQDYYPFDAILSAISCKIFYEKLRLLDHLSAHAMFLPFVTSLALWILFRFLSRHADRVTAAIAVAILLTIPRFYGQTVFNIRAEVTMAAMFILTMVWLAEWLMSQTTRHLYLGMTALACGVATKPDAILAPFLVGLWFLPSLVRAGIKDARPSWRTVFHVITAGLLCIAVYVALYPPLHPWRTGQLEFLTKMVTVMKANASWPTVTWNLYAPLQLLYTLPVLVLAAAIVGLTFAMMSRHRDPVTQLFALWAILPVARHCLPHVNHYDADRHFYYAYPAIAALATFGLVGLAGWLGRMWCMSQTRIATVFCACTVALNVWGLAEMHPYEYAFNNVLIGGLHGAQASNLPYAGDYMATCMRGAGRWLDANASPGAHYFATHCESAFQYHVTRSDLRTITSVNTEADILPNTYLLVVPRLFYGGVSYNPYMHQRQLFIASRYPKVYEIRRQDGLIASVHYNPPRGVTAIAPTGSK